MKFELRLMDKAGTESAATGYFDFKRPGGLLEYVDLRDRFASVIQTASWVVFDNAARSAGVDYIQLIRSAAL
jgi:hypothetical protein